ncbi:MAG: chorismate synthase [Ruminococcaceae bacterium]|nr:chorismate synthase [Oscillospiraceae bacterium]
MSFTYGDNIKISIFGQSHSEKMGVMIENLPAGFALDEDKLARFMARRAPGNDSFSTPRKEADAVRIVSGLVGGKTCGSPFCAEIENTNTRSADYASLQDTPRPSHADYAAWAKWGDSRDVSGGGQFSGRLTAPMCIAGGVLKQMLEAEGIYIGAHIASIASEEDDCFDACLVSQADFVDTKEFPTLNDEAAERMKAVILAAKSRGDSVGGSIECAVCGMPAGIGDTYFGGLENRISSTVFAIPAVKAIEFGAGTKAGQMLGSEHNDPFTVTKTGDIRTVTNHHGGILGGLSSGMPILFRAWFKPTPSIAIEQQTVSLSRRKNTTLAIKGRHDPCIVKRAVPCVEAAAAIAIANLIL